MGAFFTARGFGTIMGGSSVFAILEEFSYVIEQVERAARIELATFSLGS